jgi:hypothetical protein
VICNFCFVGLHQWEPQDSIAEEHRKNSPNCPFLISPTTCGNIPLMKPLRPTAPAFAPQSSLFKPQVSNPFVSTIADLPKTPAFGPISKPKVSTNPFVPKTSQMPDFEPITPIGRLPRTPDWWQTSRPLPNSSSTWRSSSTVSEPCHAGASRGEAAVNRSVVYRDRSRTRTRDDRREPRRSQATQTEKQTNCMNWFKFRDCL